METKKIIEGFRDISWDGHTLVLAHKSLAFGHVMLPEPWNTQITFITPDGVDQIEAMNDIVKQLTQNTD